MTKILEFLQAWFTRRARGDRGATMIEYGLLAFLISIAAIAALLLIGPRLLQIFTDVATALTP